MNIFLRGTISNSVLLLVLGVFLVLILGFQVSAAPITQTYSAQKKLAKGTIVSLDKGANVVVEASRQNLSNLYGVVAEEGDLSFGQSDNKSSVLIANGGVVEALVSTSSGDIDSGDPITVDAITGVGEKATKSSRIIGVAQDKLHKESPGTQHFTLSGDNSTVQIGLIPIKIEVRNYDVTSGQVFAASGKSRNKFMQVADSIAGKQVKPYALIVGGLVLLFGIFLATFMITSSGYASLIAIGRNPLAEKSIVRSLMRLLGTAVIVFVLSLVIAYGAITLL